MIGIDEGHVDPIYEQRSVQRQRLDAAGIDAHVLDQQVSSDSTAEDGASAEGCCQTCPRQKPCENGVSCLSWSVERAASSFSQ